MNKLNIFIFSCIFYISWIFINNFFENIYISLIALFFIELFFLVIYIKTKKFKLLFLFCNIFFIIWVFISNNFLIKVNENFNYLNNFLNKRTTIISEIQEVKEVKSDKIVYKTKILTLNNKKTPNKIFAEVHIKKFWDKRLEKWQIIESTTKIYNFKNFNGFSYKNYMISNWYYFRYFANNFKEIQKNEINIIEKNIISLRENLLSVIKKIYPENEAIFLWWILLWAREELPKELETNFNNSWLTHFIAVSGFNITILIVFFSIFVKFLPRALQVLTMLTIILLFVILVWPTPPVVRAWIMGFIGYLVLQNSRQWNILSIWLLTLAIMVSYSPFSINYDVSLHLSFLAVLWIIYTEKFFNNLFKFLPEFFEIRTAVSITFSALVFTLPVMIFNFWQLSTISPISNVLVSWSIPLAMLLWFLSIIWYFITAKIWIFIWFFAYLLLRWDIFVVNFFWSIEFLVLKTDFWVYKWFFEIIYLMALVFIVLYFRVNKKEEK